MTALATGRSLAAALALAVLAAPPMASANPYADDARMLSRIALENYAYADRFGADFPLDSPVLRDQAAAVTTDAELLRHAERALLALADHHAITARSLADSWALVPSYADLWIVERGGRHVIDAARRIAGRARRGPCRG